MLCFLLGCQRTSTCSVFSYAWTYAYTHTHVRHAHKPKCRHRKELQSQTHNHSVVILTLNRKQQIENLATVQNKSTENVGSPFGEYHTKFEAKRSSSCTSNSAHQPDKISVETTTISLHQLIWTRYISKDHILHVGKPQTCPGCKLIKPPRWTPKRQPWTITKLVSPIRAFRP